jgi:ABC-2 type transport system ATP-binding protein
VSDHAIEVRRLRKSYGGIERLHGVSFSVDYGEVFGFLGTNGAGEDHDDRDPGGLPGSRRREVSVLGADPARAGRDWRNRVGLVLQESELNPVYTVRENGRDVRTVLQPADRSRCGNCLCRAGG